MVAIRGHEPLYSSTALNKVRMLQAVRRSPGAAGGPVLKGIKSSQNRLSGEIGKLLLVPFDYVS